MDLSSTTCVNLVYCRLAVSVLKWSAAWFSRSTSASSGQARVCAIPPGGTSSKQTTTAASGKSILTADSALFADPHIVPHHRSVLCPNRLDADECEGVAQVAGENLASGALGLGVVAREQLGAHPVADAVRVSVHAHDVEDGLGTVDRLVVEVTRRQQHHQQEDDPAHHVVLPGGALVLPEDETLDGAAQAAQGGGAVGGRRVVHPVYGEPLQGEPVPGGPVQGEPRCGVAAAAGSRMRPSRMCTMRPA